MTPLVRRRHEPGVVPSILEVDPRGVVRRFENLPAGCTLVEIRADHLRATDIGGLIQLAPRPVIVTVRGKEEGGFFDGSPEEHREILEQATRAGAAYVDVAWKGIASDLAVGPTADRVVLSHHGGSCDGDKLGALYSAMARTSAARLKIVPRASGVAEACVVRDLLRRAEAENRELASFALGAAAAFTRIFALSWGSWATYGSIDAASPTAEGQLTVEDLIEVYDVARLAPTRRRIALVGKGVSSSPSPAMHAAAYRESGIDALYFPLEIDRIDEVMPLAGPAGSLGLEGLAVTIPLKEEAARRSTLDDEIARRSMAVNTVRIDERGWRGFNTDGPAALDSIRRHLDPRGARVVVAGAGGTARAIAAALQGAGADVALYGRNRSRCERSASMLGVASRDFEELSAASWDVFVQATPLGRGGETVLPADALKGRLVLDVVYGPEPTPLVREARARGLAVVDGFELLVGQAVLQIEILLGARPRVSTIARAGQAWLASRSTANVAGDLDGFTPAA